MPGQLPLPLVELALYKLCYYYYYYDPHLWDRQVSQSYRDVHVMESK